MDFTLIKKNLEALGYTVSCFDTAKDATLYLENTIKNKSIGFGGTMTAKEMGLYDILGKNNDIVCHWLSPKDASLEDALLTAAHTEIYISSVNGIAETGEIVNIDGTCNRISSTLYGHKKVYFLIGKNKIAPDYDAALYRARNVASPLNARRLNRNTPCTKGELRCHNCKSPERICKALTVFWEKPQGSDYEIVLINEDLGY